MSANTIDTISDAIVAQVVAIGAFNARTVMVFEGDLAELLNQTTFNFPFCGVSLEGIEWDEDSYTTDNLNTLETFRFNLMIIEQDFRGQGLARTDAYALIEAIRDTLKGDILSLTTATPCKIISVEKDEDAFDQGLVGYNMIVEISQAL